MGKFSKSFSVFVITLGVGSPLHSYANASPQMCQAPLVTFKSDQLADEGRIKVSSDRAELISDKRASFTGKVEIISDSSVINANSATVLDSGETLIAEGQVNYQDSLLNVASESLSVDSKARSLEISETQYELTAFGGRGEAESINVKVQEGIRLQDVSFTTCPLNSVDWQLRASEISFRQGATVGEARHTRFYIKDVPIFYLPYFAFPVGTQRQSGLLFPNITSSSQAGIDVQQPIYWNIAPNYDLTLTPRLMSLRGLQLKTEFRYLTQHSAGTINIDYLPEDNDLESRDSRYFYRFYHQQKLSEKWFLNADVNGLSDSNYIIDLGSDFYNRADTHVTRTFGFDYLGDYLNASFYLRDFDILGENISTYRALPEIKLDAIVPLFKHLEVELNSEFAYFDNADDTAPKALRLHIAPTFRLPVIRHWGEVSAEATLFNTLYHQTNLAASPELEEDVNRTIGQGRFYGTLYFEREGSWLGKNSSMTFEPKLQYLYTSFSDQSNIALYDSALLFTDVNGLFRGREFTGLDRISDNNQITLGATTRVIDSANREQFVFSLGQIFYFERSRVADFRGDDSRSALATEIDWKLNHNWLLHGDALLSSNSQKVDRSSVTLGYYLSSNKLIQLTHRYVRNLSNETIDQLGLSVSWPIAKNWQWVGRVYRDVERNRSVETYSGLEYESCCWSIRVVAQRSLTNRFDNSGAQSLDEYDSGISMQFSFKGIGTGTSRRQLLEDGIFGYRQPYNLN